MGRAKLEDHLLLGTKVQGLLMATAPKIPDVESVAVAGFEKNVGIEAVLDHVGSTPFAGDESVVAEVPPEVVVETLRAAFDFPFTEHIKGFRVEDEDAARTVA